MNAALPESSDEGGADVKTIPVALVERRASARDVMAFNHQSTYVSPAEIGGSRQTGDSRPNDDRVIHTSFGHAPLEYIKNGLGPKWNGYGLF